MTRTVTRIAVGAIALLLALPGVAAATTNEPIAQTGGMEATLPLLGTSLTVGITLDATGNVTGVALSPSGLAQVSASDGQVTFSSADGSVKVKVKAGGDRLSISARTTLAALTGTGSWRADVFGTGAKSAVTYTVGDDGTGTPTVSINAVDAAAGLEASPLTTKMSEQDGDEAVTAGVAFAFNGYVKRFTVRVRVNDDGSATLKLTLSGKDRQRLAGTLASLAGSRTWSAHLCDGTPISVAYHLTDTGDLVFDEATGAPATSQDVAANKHDGDHASDGEHDGGSGQGDGSLVDGFRVRFTDTRVSFRAALVLFADGSYALQAKGRSGRCESSDGHDGSGSHDGSRDGSGSHDGSGSGSHDGSGSGGDGSGSGSGGDGSGSGDEGRDH